MTTRVTVTPPAGQGPYGPVEGTAVAVRCWPEEATKVVRAADGSDVVSSTRLWCEPTKRNRDACVIGATVDHGGRAAEVVAVAVHDPGRIRLPRLLEVTLA